jgi:aconitase A
MKTQEYREVRTLKLSGKSYSYVSLKHLEERGRRIQELSVSIRILLENILRHAMGGA